MGDLETPGHALRNDGERASTKHAEEVLVSKRIISLTLNPSVRVLSCLFDQNQLRAAVCGVETFGTALHLYAQKHIMG